MDRQESNSSFMEKRGRIFETLEAMKPKEDCVLKARLFIAKRSKTKEEFKLLISMLGLQMICKSCREAADNNQQELHCNNNDTWCDCQHKPVAELNDETTKEN